uniref:hypothetical protein n=1 Tax=uncultured Streptococcus sp. TaxID=83427 RepID=UPI0028E264E9
TTQKISVNGLFTLKQVRLSNYKKQFKYTEEKADYNKSVFFFMKRIVLQSKSLKGLTTIFKRVIIIHK